jgi:citrate synthase
MLIKSIYAGFVERMLSSEQAALRLGVKVPTLYAYVSRGRLESHRDPSGRGSLFELADVEALARRGRGGRQTETRLVTVTTGVTQLRLDEGPFYRGQSAVTLSTQASFEQVASILLEDDSPEPWLAPDLGVCPLTHTADRMRWTLVMCAAADPLRADPRREAVARSARRVMAALTDVVGPGGADEDGATPIARRLASRLGRLGGAAEAVNASLILMADHELATSTMAVRVAASTRADIYDALLAGLATLSGPLHGGDSQQAFGLLATAERDGASRALNEFLRQQRRLPGFGHMVYKNGDPRVVPLLALVEPLLSAERQALLREVMAIALDQQVPRPNIDLALAALSWGTGMPADAGATIFSVARIAGWAAHYLEELSERPLRYRARAVYSR